MLRFVFTISCEIIMETAITAIGTANPINKRYQKDIAELISIGLQLKPSRKEITQICL